AECDEREDEQVAARRAHGVSKFGVLEHRLDASSTLAAIQPLTPTSSERPTVRSHSPKRPQSVESGTPTLPFGAP
ncbi:MAG: hypothetical protein ABI664_22040, partial [bacterium]